MNIANLNYILWELGAYKVVIIYTIHVIIWWFMINWLQVWNDRKETFSNPRQREKAWNKKIIFEYMEKIEK